MLTPALLPCERDPPAHACACPGLLPCILISPCCCMRIASQTPGLGCAACVPNLLRVIPAGASTKARLQVVPILRAGLVLLEQASTVLPNAATYHVGYVRDEATLEVRA